MIRIKRVLLKLFAFPFSERVGSFITFLIGKKLKKKLFGKMTDKFLEFLLSSLDAAFDRVEGYRRNIIGFKGKYVFETKDKRVAASAIFENDDMQWDKNAIKDWDVRITFKDPAALRELILSGEPDILDSILNNKIEMDGNTTYAFKFIFMYRDLEHRLGLV